MAGDIRPVLKFKKFPPFKSFIKTPQSITALAAILLPFVSWSVDSIFKPFPRSVACNFNEKINTYHICYN